MHMFDANTASQKQFLEYPAASRLHTVHLFPHHQILSLSQFH